MADYLIHFNRNHNPKNGQFDFGDGDGDGIRNDHSRRSRSNNKHPITKKYKADDINKIAVPKYYKSPEYKKEISNLQNKAYQMIKDFKTARDEQGIGENAKKYYKLEKEISDEANKRIKNEYEKAKERGEEWVGDTYWDKLYLEFDKIFDERGIDQELGSISNLIDLGYTEKDAKDINKFINSVGYHINFNSWDKKKE